MNVTKHNDMDTGGLSIDYKVIHKTMNYSKKYEKKHKKMFNNLTHDTALVIFPPQSQMGGIQKIRMNDDEWYKRVLPHVTLLWPFVNENVFW